MIGLEEADRLKRELVGLFGHMNRMRRELAALQGADTVGDFNTMADTLDAIVQNTEAASNTILESAESIDALVSELRQDASGPALAVCDKITDHINAVFEACSFQDLTGQRITRVVNSLKFVEERVGSMVRMWGKDELAEAVAEIKRQSAPVDTDKALLHGPQSTEAAISQDDVDKLFSQSDIDKMFD